MFPDLLPRGNSRGNAGKLTESIPLLGPENAILGARW